MAETLFFWVTVGDEKVCADCEALGQMEPRTLAEWEAGGFPGIRGTLCNGNCRCSLVPDVSAGRLQQQLESLAEKGFTELTDQMKAGLQIDLTRGGKILLKDFKQIKGLLTVPYSDIVRLENLTADWKMSNGTLPPEYFALADIAKQTAWLIRGGK